MPLETSRRFPLLVLQLALLLLSPTSAQRECSDYVNITDPTRSVKVDSRTTGTLLCDRHERWLTNSEWIRFSIPGKTRMPEYCPSTYACNTHAPGWLNGSHPKVKDGAVLMRACFHWNWRCCHWQYPISVRNCTNFYVYQLSRIYACLLRLCADVNPCVSGHHQCDLQSSYCKITGEYSYSCPCKTGYSGVPGNCTAIDDINPCTSNRHQCDPWSSNCLITGENSYSCPCKDGFTGDPGNCTEFNPCLSGSHQCDWQSSHCEFAEENSSYSCPCRNGFTGVPGNCVDINECENGTHDCDQDNGICSNTPGSYTCQCRPGYTGNGRYCTDLDECASGIHNCHDLGVCTNNVGSFTCHCQRGYTGNGMWCTVCPQNSVCIQTSPTSCDCWCKLFYPGNPEVTPCDECQDALGMENGWISDGQISASSEFPSHPLGHHAYQARLHFQETLQRAGGWAAGQFDINPWLQVDLGSQHRVTRLATQGRNGHNQWVTKFNLQYSDHGVIFKYYREQGRIVTKEFVGNKDMNTVVYHGLNPPIGARYIRVVPVDWHYWISMRIELYGCQENLPDTYAVPEVNILNAGLQPDRPKRFRRDESRTFQASFSLAKDETGQISFSWTISNHSPRPPNNSENGELFAHNTRELNIGRRFLQVGLKLVVFELRIAGKSMAFRDFAFLRVEESALVARIAGGTEVQRSIRKPIVLDGTPSYDPEEEKASRALNFTWSCFQAQENASDFSILNGNISQRFKSLLNHVLNKTLSSNEEPEILSKVTNFTGKSLTQLPNSMFNVYPEHGRMILNTPQLINNNTYYVLLTVRKNDRIAHYMQTLHIRDEDMLDIEIRCVLSCGSIISSSSRIALRTSCKPMINNCHRAELTYRWNMFKQEGNHSQPQWKYQTDLVDLLATKEDSKNLVLKIIAPGSSYRLTVDVLSPEGARGWAAYHFETSAAPSGGTCYVTKWGREAALGTSLNITCQGWSDKNEHLMYQFYRKIKDGRFDLLSYESLPHSTVHILPGPDEAFVHIKVAIINILGTATEEFLQIQVDPPSLPKSEEILHAELLRQLTKIDRLLTLGQIDSAIQESEVLLLLLKVSEDRVNETLHKQLGKLVEPVIDTGREFQSYLKILEHIISKMSDVRVGTLERLLQIAVILGRATEGVTKLPGNMTLLVVEKLLHMAPVLLLKAKYKSDTRLLGDVARSYMYCISNIKMSASLTKLHESQFDANSTRNGSSLDEAWLRSERLSGNLTEMITNTMLSLMLPGEEYTVIKNELDSTILGKQEVQDLDHLQVNNEDAGFEFPHLGNETLESMFGRTSEVGIQMITYTFNPQASPNSTRQVNSNVVNIDLKDNNGHALQIKNLPDDIIIKIPVSQNYGNNTPLTDHFLNPELMQYHSIHVQQPQTTVKFSTWVCLQASFTAYIRYGEKPSELVFDEVVVLPSKGNNSGSHCRHGNDNVRDIWITAKRPGRYYIGLRLGNEGTETVQSPRKRRSVSLEISSADHCIKFKPAPPTSPPPDEFAVVNPEYNPTKSTNYSVQVTTFWCTYWDDAEERWSSEGCKAGHKSNGSNLECLCNHLTSFGGDLLVAPNTIDFGAVKQTMENPDLSDLLVLVTICSVSLVYFLVLLFARRADKKDIVKNGPLILLNHTDGVGYEYEVSITTGAWRNSGTSANVSMILYGMESASEVIYLTDGGLTDRELFAQGNTDNFLVSLQRPLGSLIKVQIGHDNSGKAASWFLSEISVTDCQTGHHWLFTCYRWLALERDDGNITRALYSESVEGSEMEFKRKFSMLQKNGFADEHLWWSVVSKQPRNSFTRVQRASCCCCFLFLYMVTSAMFYETENANQQTITIGPFKVTPSQLIIALETIFITLPPSGLITFLFRKSESKSQLQGRKYNLSSSQKRECLLPHFCTYIAWFLCVSASIVSALFTVFYSLMWGGEKSARWLSSVVLSVTGDVFVSQPIKIVIVSLIVASKCGRSLRLRGSAQERNVQPLFHLSSDELQQAKKFKTNERKMFKFIKELFFLLLFFFLLMVVCYSDKNDHRYELTASTENGFQRFDKIRNNTQFWEWMNEVFVGAIFSSNWYNGQEEKFSEYIGNKRSILVGMPRLRQLRIMKNSCEVPAIFRKMINFCHDSYSLKDEDRDTWDSQTGSFDRSSWSCPQNWEYSKDEGLGSFDSRGRFAVYRGGGYLANLGYNKLVARRVISDLVENNWIDSRTRAVIVEFSLFNPSTNTLSVMSYFYEILPSGFSGTFKSYGMLPLASSDSQAHNAYLFFVLLFGVFLLCYFIIECIKLFRQKCSYFKSLWNWMEVFQILTASLALIFQAIKFQQVTTTLDRLKKNPFIPVSFHQALHWSEAETVALCTTSAIATLRLLKCFHFNHQVIKLSSFMRSHLPSLISFFVIFCVLSTGYGLSGMIAFGSKNALFSSFGKAFISQFLTIIGNNELIREIGEGEIIMGRLFLAGFVFTTVIFMTNMFVAVLNDSYSHSCLDKEKEEFEIAEFMVRRILQTVFGYKPEDNDYPSSFQRANDKNNRDDLSESTVDEDRFENNAWRSNWSFAAKATPVMYRSRKVSFAATSDAFYENTAVVTGEEDDAGLFSLWETFKTKDMTNNTEFKESFHSDISEDSESVESQGMTWDSTDEYRASDVTSTSSNDLLWQFNNRICDMLTARSSLSVDNDDDEDYYGDEDSDDDAVGNAAFVDNVAIDGECTPNADEDYADDGHPGYSRQVERDVWKEILHLLNDNCSSDNSWDDCADQFPVGMARYSNSFAVEDSD